MASEFGINGLDLVVFGIILIAALLGLAVGFVRGVLYVISWIGAAAMAIYGFPYVRPFVREQISNPTIADVVGAAGLFIAAMAAFFLISALLTRWVRGSHLNALDRSLGFVAAAGTAVFLLCAVYIPYRAFVPEGDQPEWVREARVIPLIELGSRVVETELLDRVDQTMLPRRDDTGSDLESPIDKGATVRRLSEPRIAPDGEAGSEIAPAYQERDRQQMNRLLESVQQQ